MSKMLFKPAGTGVTPVLPVDAAGEALLADGTFVLDVDQAAERTNLTRRELIRMYEAVWPDVLPDVDILGTPAPPVGSFIVGPRPVLEDFEKLALEHELRYPDLTVREFEMFDAARQALGIPRFCRAIHPYVRPGADGKRTIELHTSIHELRRIAMTHPDYAGEDEPEYMDENDDWHQVWTGEKPPVAARVTVYRRMNGEKITFRRVARWKAYAPVLVAADGTTSLPPIWEKTDAEMLGKCASALANRAAFGGNLKGLYTHDEMEQARAAEAERRQTHMPPRPPLPEHSQLRYEADASADESQLDVFDIVDDPPTDEAEFNARLAKLIPDRHVRAATLDAYLRKWRQQYRTNRSAFWAAVLVAVGRQAAANNN